MVSPPENFLFLTASVTRVFDKYRKNPAMTMANEHYNIYGGNPTAGAVDGTITPPAPGELPTPTPLPAKDPNNRLISAQISIKEQSICDDITLTVANCTF